MKRTGFDDDLKEYYHYRTIVVAIPSDFNIEQYLSLREQAGMFNNTSVKKEDLVILANTVRDSVIFKFFSDTIPQETISYFVKILSELGVIIDILHTGVKTRNLVSINVLSEKLNGLVVKAIKNIVTVEESV